MECWIQALSPVIDIAWRASFQAQNDTVGKQGEWQNKAFKKSELD